MRRQDRWRAFRHRIMAVYRPEQPIHQRTLAVRILDPFHDVHKTFMEGAFSTLAVDRDRRRRITAGGLFGEKA